MQRERHKGVGIDRDLDVVCGSGWPRALRLSSPLNPLRRPAPAANASLDIGECLPVSLPDVLGGGGGVIVDPCDAVALPGTLARPLS